MDDEYIRDIADVIERDVEPGESGGAINMPKKQKGCGAIAMGLGEKRSEHFQQIEETLMGPPKTNV